MSEVQICNQALSLLGGNLITSLDDNTKEANLCRLNYDSLRDSVLQERDWTFATRWETLAKVEPAPLGEYKNAFQLPADTLVVLFVGQEYNRQTRRWQVEDNRIRTDETTCKAQLLVQVTDTAKFSPMFTQALAQRLAAEMAIPLVNSRTLAEQHFALYTQKIRLAASRDSQQGRTRRLRSRWLSQARYADGGRWASPVV